MALHFLVLLFFVVIPTAITLYVAYWVVRLGVRHGVQDAHRSIGQPGGTASRL